MALTLQEDLRGVASPEIFLSLKRVSGLVYAIALNFEIQWRRREASKKIS
jgi:hypothetical protein